MKLTGITRRIDELGRIVIPKEIRKNMHIKQGDLLEIYLNSNEEIILKKYSIINKDQTFIFELMNLLSNKLNCNVIITSLDEIIYSTDCKLVGEKICNNSNLISNNTNDKILLTKKYKIKENSRIYPMVPNGDLAGYIILELESSLESEQERLLNFCINYINNCLENG